MRSTCASTIDLRSAAAALLLAVAAAVVPVVAAAAQAVELDFFYGTGCPHCADMRERLARVRERHPQLQVREHEVYSDAQNAQLLQRVAAGYGVAVEGVPAVFVGERAIFGTSAEAEAALERAVGACAERGCGSPLARAAATPSPALTVSAVIAGAAVDAINPCEFAVLIVLLTAILAAGGRGRALAAGLAFCLSIFISYYLMGLGLFSAVHAAGLTRALYSAFAILAIVIGLFNLKDFFWYGRGFTMEVPQSWRPAMRGTIRRVTSVPGAFAVGFVVSLFLLPCTSGPYIVIVGLLAQTATRTEALLWLLLYNVIFVLPMALITLAVYLGWTTTERLAVWRERNLERLHLVAGTVLLLLGLAMLLSLRLDIS